MGFWWWGGGRRRVFGWVLVGSVVCVSGRCTTGSEHTLRCAALRRHTRRRRRRRRFRPERFRASPFDQDQDGESLVLASPPVVSTGGHTASACAQKPNGKDQKVQQGKKKRNCGTLALRLGRFWAPTDDLRGCTRLPFAPLTGPWLREWVCRGAVGRRRFAGWVSQVFCSGCCVCVCVCVCAGWQRRLKNVHTNNAFESRRVGVLCFWGQHKLRVVCLRVGVSASAMPIVFSHRLPTHNLARWLADRA